MSNRQVFLFEHGFGSAFEPLETSRVFRGCSLFRSLGGFNDLSLRGSISSDPRQLFPLPLRIEIRGLIIERFRGGPTSPSTFGLPCPHTIFSTAASDSLRFIQLGLLLGES